MSLYLSTGINKRPFRWEGQPITKRRAGELVARLTKFASGVTGIAPRLTRKVTVILLSPGAVLPKDMVTESAAPRARVLGFETFLRTYATPHAQKNWNAWNRELFARRAAEMKRASLASPSVIKAEIARLYNAIASGNERFSRATTHPGLPVLLPARKRVTKAKPMAKAVSTTLAARSKTKRVTKITFRTVPQLRKLSKRTLIAYRNRMLALESFPERYDSDVKIYYKVKKATSDAWKELLQRG